MNGPLPLRPSPEVLPLQPVSVKPRRRSPDRRPIYDRRRPVRLRFVNFGEEIHGWTYAAQPARGENPAESPEICISQPWWDKASPTERRRVLCHELGHTMLPGTFHRMADGRRATTEIRRTEYAVDVFAAYLTQIPNLGALLVTAGHLTAADGALLDALFVEVAP